MTEAVPPRPPPRPAPPTRPADPDATGAAAVLAPGLHVVATPIGAARDITLRALDILATADILLAEDTRTLRRLFDIHGLKLGGRALWAYHDHNGAQMRPRVLAALAEGRTVALVSDAGTPLVADPGYQMVRAAIAAGHPVLAAPGASASLAALTVAGLPTDRFAFLGFAPATAGARARFLSQVMDLPMTTILYESPRRIHRLLADCAQTDPERPAALCRELTKRHEEVIRGPLSDIAAQIAGRDLKGEIVLVLGGMTGQGSTAADLDLALGAELGTGPLRDVVDRVARRLGLPRRDVYQRALALRGGADQGDDG